MPIFAASAEPGPQLLFARGVRAGEVVHATKHYNLASQKPGWGISTQSITQAACPRLPGLNPKRPSHHRVSRGRCLELEFSGKNQENGDAAVGGISNGDSDGKHEAGSI